MSTNWTNADLATLEAAIARGTRRVSYQNQTVEYHSLEEMLKLRDKMQREIAAAQPGAAVAGRVLYAGRTA